MPRIIIDTDAGVDDALALLYALHRPEARIEAITVVHGNVPLQQAIRNVAEILLASGTQISFPVSAGADRPLSGEAVNAKEVHGDDGLGGWTVGRPAAELALSATPAHRLITQLARQHPNEITLITIGPLTNAALALREDPAGFRLLKDTVVMGGAISEPGNITTVAEFNIYADPQAAREVLRSGTYPLLVGLDVTRKATLTRQRLEAELDDRPAAFVRCICERMFAFYRSIRGEDFFHLHDPLVVAIALDRSLVHTRSLAVDVETSGELTRGMTVAEQRVWTHAEANAHVAVTVDQERFLSEFCHLALQE